MKLRACIVDTETTGFYHATDDLIELGLVLFEYDPITFEVGDILDEYNGLHDPGREIPVGATQAHGMTWDDVRGHKLDHERVRAILARAVLIIAHNARFDRGFVAKLYPEVARSQWCCSMDGVPWRNKGFRSKGLQELLADHGLIVETAHRALDDARNTLRLLSQRQPDGRTYLADLLQSKR
jgi:DNA polymerase III subunit epsilon